jgi:hypothetical protein
MLNSEDLGRTSYLRECVVWVSNHNAQMVRRCMCDHQHWLDWWSTDTRDIWDTNVFRKWEYDCRITPTPTRIQELEGLE